MPRVRVDELDFRILRELIVEGGTLRSDRARVEAVAKRVDVHPNTVAARIRKLARGRVFLPLTLEMDPWRGSIAGARVFLDVPPERRTAAAREALFLIEGVSTLLVHLDGWAVLLYAEDEVSLASKVDLARALTGATSALWEAHLSRDYPPKPPRKLTRLDARLIAGLLRDARASLPRLAKEMGVTSRTLERRYGKLAEEGVVAMLPGGAAEIEGLVLGYLAASIPESGKARERAVQGLLALLPNHFLVNAEPIPRAEFLLFSPSVSDLAAQAESARKVEGVRGATFRILVEVHPNPRHADWLARVLERRAG